MNSIKKNKVCIKCGIIKTIDNFYRSIKSSDGLRNDCKECSNKRYKIWSQTSGRKKIRECNNRYYHKNKNSVEYRFLRLKTGAKQRHKELGIDFEDFKELWKENCYYCGDEVNTAGLDRVDSSKGYIKGNIVRCCEKCNRAKNNMDINEFLIHCKKIVNKHNDTYSSAK